MVATSQALHVAAAVIRDPSGRVLITRRHAHQHQGGLWEFPGGKLEAGETAQQALVRELDEELGIRVDHARPLLRVFHAYPELDVLLDVWSVERFSGVAHGREGQPLLWVTPATLPDYSFPAANLPIVNAVLLPDRYLITPDPGCRAAWPEFMAALQRSLRAGVSLVQLRAPHLPVGDYADLADEVLACCHTHGARLLLNAAPSMLERVAADGLHLNSLRLQALGQRPAAGLVAASCHDAAQLRRAMAIGVDFVVVSPVLATATHPGAEPLGWDGLFLLTEQSTLPVYALGGMAPKHLGQAWSHGAQGIAAIRGLWQD